VRWYDSLRRQGEIAFLRRRGRQIGLPTLAAFGAEERGSRSRIAISVSTSIGGAVVRNLIRRRIRGALDERAAPKPLRILFVARPPAASEPYARLAADVGAALERLRSSEDG
jgi:ribonuclease P protein component